MSAQKLEALELGRDETVAVPIVEEQVVLGKRVVETGRVRVQTSVDTVDEVFTARLEAEHVEIERVPVGLVVASAPPVREVDGVTIIPVLEERLVVTRELVLVEEVRLRRVRTASEVNEIVPRRVMRATVDRADA